MHEYIMPLSFQRPPLNQNDRMHWAKKARIVKSVRHESMVRARAARLKPGRRLPSSSATNPGTTGDATPVISQQHPNP